MKGGRRVPLLRGRAARGLLTLALCGIAGAAFAAQPQFWKIEGARDFLDGDTEGLSVDSEGRVRLAPASKLLHDTEAPYIWALARDDKGVLYAGTGNDGKVFRVRPSGTDVFLDAEELEVHAVAVGPDDRLYAGSSPEGKVYRVAADGKAETFYDPTDKYIWALAFDKAGNLLVATGAEGRIHRVDKKGKAEVLFTSTETHVTALTTDASGNVYAGSASSGILYRIASDGRVFVLHDSPFREVKAIEVGPDGSVYAAMIDGKDKEDAVRPAAPPPPVTTPAAEVTVTESFSVLGPTGLIPASSASSAAPPRPGDTARAGAQKGALVRVAPSGEVDTIWSSTDEMPHAIVRGQDGVILGTGNRGKLYRVKDDRTWTMVADFPAEQVTGLHRRPDGTFALATSNPGKVYDLDSTTAARGTFTSKVKDTETVSTWGRLRWDAVVPAGTEVQIQTRSGNTAAPDSTWSDWSAPYSRREGERVTSERARFVQVKAVLTGTKGASPVLDTISTAYLQRNLRPQVVSISVHPPGEVFQKPLSVTGEMEILGLEPGHSPEARPGAPAIRPNLPPATSYSRKLYQRGLQTFSWKAEDPNGDAMAYEVRYRRVDETRFHLLRKVTEPVMAWDTSTVPNGRYVVRVGVNDSPGNPESLALSSDKESAPFEVDNTPPTVSASLVAPNAERVRAVARDDSSIIRKAEYSLDGGRWQEVHPTDGINDALEESYEIALATATPGPHVLVVRAYDLLGNLATALVEVP